MCVYVCILGSVLVGLKRERRVRGRVRGWSTCVGSRRHRGACGWG